MHGIDWFILIATLSALVGYGVYKSRRSQNLEGYFLSNRSMSSALILLSIMGTQASAITYLTGPGQSFSDGMRFVQYYFGLPLAMIVISIFFVPAFSKLNVLTAYEFLEHRFDRRTRLFTSFLFLISRGLSTGISIYAPSLVLSSLMGWNIYLTNLVTGSFLIIYTITGGARAVALTQRWQMLLVFGTLIALIVCCFRLLPEHTSFTGLLQEAGHAGKLNIITSGMTEKGFDWKDKYNIWSGLIGGFFLALSYFGTDHSQVGRYLTAKDSRESRLALLWNGLVKVPMQFVILFIGVLIFMIYQNTAAPVYFNEVYRTEAMQTTHRSRLQELESKFREAQRINNVQQEAAIRKAYRAELKEALPGKDVNDTNFIFLHFVRDQLPAGLVGLIIAILFISAWGSIAAALNSLAACSMVDFHQQFSKKNITEGQSVQLSKMYTLGWGLFCIAISMFAHQLGNSLIETVNIIGSLFYGVILGIFLVALWMRRVGAVAIFWAACLAEILVVAVFYLDVISFLWLNMIGAVAVVIMSWLLQYFTSAGKQLKAG